MNSFLLSFPASGVVSCFRVNQCNTVVRGCRSWPGLNSVVLLQMSFVEDLPDVDGTDLLGLLFQSEENGPVEPLFPVENGLIESWLSEQVVRLHTSILVDLMFYIYVMLILKHLPGMMCLFVCLHDYITLGYSNTFMTCTYKYHQLRTAKNSQASNNFPTLCF